MVESIDEASADSSWEGSIAVMTKFVDKKINKIEASLSKKVERVYQCVIEAEARDATQEREVQISQDKMLKQQQRFTEELATEQKEMIKELHQNQKCLEEEIKRIASHLEGRDPDENPLNMTVRQRKSYAIEHE